MIDESRGWPELSEQNLLALMEGHLPPADTEQAVAYFGVLRERVVRELVASDVANEEWLSQQELIGVYGGLFGDLHRHVATVQHKQAMRREV